jgi:membrane peptidoglycan carboxypeptidase
VRDSEGRVAEQRAPREVRRVIPADVARELTTVLEDVVEDGTATAARIDNFRVAGKTGTSRAHVNGSYSAGRYYSSFVGFFPADAPQLVVFVKLDSPKGTYYGGATAAPVTRAMMEGALAARQTPPLLKSLRRAPSAALAAAARVQRPAPPARHESAAGAPLRFANVEAGPRAQRRDAALAALEPMRPTASAAVRRLHALGFRVRWQGYGTVVTTLPAAGARLEQGDTVALRGAVSLQ